MAHLCCLGQNWGQLPCCFVVCGAVMLRQKRSLTPPGGSAAIQARAKVWHGKVAAAGAGSSRHSLTKIWRRGRRPSGLGIPDQLHRGAVALGAMAKDFFHNTVRRALAKDGWTITHDPLKVVVGSDYMLIDLAGERLFLAERDAQYIAVEVKGLGDGSEVNSFHAVIGQYLHYRLALREKHAQYRLYLAIPEEVYLSFYQRKFVQLSLKEHQVAVLVYDIQSEVIINEYLP
jgi:XisH protein